MPTSVNLVYVLCLCTVATSCFAVAITIIVVGYMMMYVTIFFPFKSIWLFSLCFCNCIFVWFAWLLSHANFVYLRIWPCVYETKRKSHLNESNRTAHYSHNSLSIFNRQCRCQLKCRWLLAVSVHFPSIMIAIISINVNDSHINNSNSVLIHLLHGIDRVNDSFGLSNQMENVFGCVSA